MIWCHRANTFLDTRLYINTKWNWSTVWIVIFEARFNLPNRSILTLHEFGGTSNWVISPACTQKRCNNVPLYKSHRQTAKSTPPDSKCDLSYLNTCTKNKSYFKLDVDWVYFFLHLMKMLITLDVPTMDTANSWLDHDALIKFDVLAILRRINGKKTLIKFHNIKFVLWTKKKNPI